MNKTKYLQITDKRINLPAFVPDGTFGVVRSVDAADLQACGVQAVMMNTFHLMQKPGSSTIQALGGLGAFSGWQGLIFTDSGGFQAYSLIRQNPKFGRLSQDGISFQSQDNARKFLLTPEKCIRLQLSYGSNLLFCLDDCTHVDEAEAEQIKAVKHTVAWAKRCKREYLNMLDLKKIDTDQRPLLFAIVQGGNSRDLRRECAEFLLEIGFDGYGYGGWPLNSQGELIEDMLAYTRELIPSDFPLHALGIGQPAFMAKCFAMGYDLFDSALPTRDARHGRLYQFELQPETIMDFDKDEWWHYLYIEDKRYIKSENPISTFCDCSTCKHYSLAYLHHLFKINDCLFQRLATIHNLRLMSLLSSALRKNKS